MKVGVALTRVLIGGLFVGHGTQKLFGWFGGGGLEATGGFFESLGFRPGKRHAALAGGSETAGGALLATGFLTPAASALLTGVMVQAIRSVHADKGPWVTEGGWEYPAVIIAGLFALTELGPGEASLDHALGTERSGVGWAALALLAGVVGPTVLTRSAEGPEQQLAEAAVAAPTGGATTPSS